MGSKNQEVLLRSEAKGIPGVKTRQEWGSRLGAQPAQIAGVGQRVPEGGLQEKIMNRKGYLTGYKSDFQSC